MSKIDKNVNPDKNEAVKTADSKQEMNKSAEISDLSEKKEDTQTTENTIETAKMNIYEKIQTAKKMLSAENIKKSGLNKFADFQYYELSDFMPSIIRIFEELKLFSKVAFTNELAILKIINADNPTEQEEYTSPMKSLEIKGANAMQTLGGMETYQRRYLYMSALDITENDMFDANSGKDKNGNNSNGDNNSSNGNVGNNSPTAPKPATGGKAASEKQIKLIYTIVNDISKGYEANGQTALPEAIIKRMKDTLKIDKELKEFLVSEASTAIDYLSKIKLQIPKADKAG